MKNDVKIAIVDDHKAVRSSLKTFLETKHFKVIIEADNGRSLLEQLNGSSELPHICILDVNMPEMNGFETAVQLKRKWPDINIIFFSMQNGSSYRKKAKEVGADAFLSKDCDTAELYKVIEDLI